MKKTFLILMSALFLSNAQTAVARDTDQLAVVELFTSQGCSSCPPADAFLGELSMRSDVLALAYHVDYWNYIGWDDPFSKAEFTQRQRQYAHTFNLRYVYTPQMIVSGDYETSGNNRRRIVSAIEDQLGQSAAVKLDIQGPELKISGDPQSRAVAVYQVDYIKEVETKVRRGENRGKTLTDYNIVTNLKELTRWQGGDKSVMIDTLHRDKEKGRAVFVQDVETLRILNAIRIY